MPLENVVLHKLARLRVIAPQRDSALAQSSNRLLRQDTRRTLRLLRWLRWPEEEGQLLTRGGPVLTVPASIWLTPKQKRDRSHGRQKKETLGSLCQQVKRTRLGEGALLGKQQVRGG